MDKIEQEKLEELYVRLMSESQTISVTLSGKDATSDSQLKRIASDQVKTNKAFASLVKVLQNSPENANFSADLYDMICKTGRINKVIENYFGNDTPEKGEN